MYHRMHDIVLSTHCSLLQCLVFNVVILCLCMQNHVVAEQSMHVPALPYPALLEQVLLSANKQITAVIWSTG